MPADTIAVFALIAAAAGMMASGKVRFDLVALLVILTLMLTGILSVGESLQGFGNPVVILIAGLLVVGEVLDRTGVANAVGDMILKKGGTNERNLIIVVMFSAGILGAVMSSTAVVAIFIPIVLRIAAQAKLNASRMLMPMSYAALISGMLTLIATPPNLVVHEELIESGFDGFGFFSFLPVGAVVLVVAIIYMLLVGRRMLTHEGPKAGGAGRVRSLSELWEDFDISEKIVSLQISEESSLGEKTIGDSGLGSRYGVRILGILRRANQGDRLIPAPTPSRMLHAGEIILAVGQPDEVQRLVADEALQRKVLSERQKQLCLWEMGCASVLIHPESKLIGKSLRESNFRSRYNLEVIGHRKAGKALPNHGDVKIEASDSLLVSGTWTRIRQLQAERHDFVVLELPAEQAEVVPAYRKLPWALVILVMMVALSVTGVVPLVTAVILAVVVSIVTRCISIEDAYRSMHWSALVLVAGMLPLATALEKTGGTSIIVEALLQAVGDSSPTVMLGVIFSLTATLGLFLSNTASAVLTAPIAITAAKAMDISPYPLAVAVLIAASAAFVTPISSPVVTLIVDPGRYRFMDFVKVGLPLLILTLVTTMIVAPLVFPF